MIRLGIIGTGGMANAHAGKFKEIKGCRLTACCDVVPGRAREFAAKHGIPAAYESAAAMFRKEKLDAVSIVTTDATHAAMALLSIRHGVHVMCEKPLASNLRDAKKMAAAAEKARVLTAVNFSYRNSPATQKAAEMVAAGALGRVIHVDGCYLQSWLVGKHWGDWRTKDMWLWRLSTRHGSGGTLGDVGVHLYDLASFVVGDIAEIACALKTFDKGMKRVGQYVLDANDSMACAVRFANGAIGALHSSRWATGYANTVAIRVFGDKGGLELNVGSGPDTLRVCLGRDIDKNAWKPVACPPVPNMYRRFITAIQKRRQGQTSFAGGVKVQAYLDASLRAAKTGGFVKVQTD